MNVHTLTDDVVLKLSPFQSLYIYVQNAIKDNNYYVHNSQLYKEIILANGVKTHAVKLVGSISDFIYSITTESSHYTQWVNRTIDQDNLQRVVWEINISNEGNRLQRNRRLWSYLNGLWDGNRNLWIPHYPEKETHEIDHIHIGTQEDLPVEFAIKYIPQEFKYKGPFGPDYHVTGEKDERIYWDESGNEIYNESHPEKGTLPIQSWMNIKTPVTQYFLKLQGMIRSIQKMFYIFVGRLVFEVGHDNWNLAPHFFGTSQIKDILTSFILQIYEESDLCNLGEAFDNRKGETAFSFESSIGKLLWYYLHIEKTSKLSGSKYATLLQPNNVRIVRKNQKAFEGCWTLPGFTSGTDDLCPSSPVNGKLHVSWEFNHSLKYNEQSSKYSIEALQKELPNFIMKCIVGYTCFLKWVGTRNIRSIGILPLFFLRNIKSDEFEDEIIQYLHQEWTIVDLTEPNLVVPFGIFLTIARSLGLDLDVDPVEVLSILEKLGIPSFQIKQEIPTFEDNEMKGDEDDGNDDPLFLESDIVAVHYNGEIYNEGCFLQGIRYKHTAIKKPDSKIIYKQ